MGDLAGRGLRVGGLFLAMLGAGLVLESVHGKLGSAILAVGLLVFGAGLARLSRGERSGEAQGP